MNTPPPPPPPLLRAQHLRFAYPGAPALVDDWSVSIGAGVTLLHGNTGAGKSTLLRVLAGAVPVSGTLVLCGNPLADRPEAYRRQVFLGDPTADAFDSMSARAVTETLSADDPCFNAAEWQSLVDGFALAPHLAKPMYMLSTGSRRKVWLAAALACGRALTLLDEPTGALDAASVACLWRALGRIAERADRAVVIASAERIERVSLVGTIELPPR